MKIAVVGGGSTYTPELVSGLTRLDVEEFVLKREETNGFLERLYSLLEFALPYYVQEGKSSLTVALGCTGGRHRSVVLVEELKRRLEGKPFRIHIKHRDIDK